jgi:hypothetical protein
MATSDDPPLTTTLQCPSCRSMTYEVELAQGNGDLFFAHCPCGHNGEVRRFSHSTPDGTARQDTFMESRVINDVSLEEVRRQVEEYANGIQRHVLLSGMRVNDEPLHGFPPGFVQYGGSQERPVFDIDDLNDLPMPIVHRDFQFSIHDRDGLPDSPPWNTHDIPPGTFGCRKCGATMRELVIHRHSVRTNYQPDGTCLEDFRNTALVRALTYAGRTASRTPGPVLMYWDQYVNMPIPPWQYTRLQAASLLNHLAFMTGFQTSTILGLINAYKTGMDNLPFLADAFEDAGFQDYDILMVLRDTSEVPQAPYPRAGDTWRQLDFQARHIPDPRYSAENWRAYSHLPLGNSIHNQNLSEPPE